MIDQIIDYNILSPLMGDGYKAGGIKTHPLVPKDVVFRSYTGAFVNFYVDKTSGTTRMEEYVPTLDVRNEAGTIDIFDYLEKEN